VSFNKDYFNQQNDCPGCGEGLKKDPQHKHCCNDNCRSYSIFISTNYIEECREFKKFDITTTYLSDRDITYFHPLFEDGYKNELDAYFSEKSILFTLSGRVLYNSNIESIIKDYQLLK